MYMYMHGGWGGEVLYPRPQNDNAPPPIKLIHTVYMYFPFS